MGQKALTLKLLQETGVTNAKSIGSPVNQAILHQETLASEQLCEGEHSRFRQIVGSIMHLAIIPRPDLCVAENMLGLDVAERRESICWRLTGY